MRFYLRLRKLLAIDLINRFKILYLYLNILLFIRAIKLNILELHDLFVIKNNVVQLSWDVTGCYKIVVDDVIKIPGNYHGLDIVYNKENEPIKITFYGVFRKITKLIEVNSAAISLIKPIEAKTNLPLLIEIDQDLPLVNVSEFRQISCHFNEGLFIEIEPLKIDNNSIKSLKK
jgi:hypothetical protein